jgi:hypothetical protein
METSVDLLFKAATKLRGRRINAVSFESIMASWVDLLNCRRVWKRQLSWSRSKPGCDRTG